MLKRMNPTRTQSWSRLREHHKKTATLHMKDMFKADEARFHKFFAHVQ